MHQVFRPGWHAAAVALWWWSAVVVASLGCLGAAVLAPRPALLLAVVVSFGLAFTVDQSQDVRDQAESGLWSAFLAAGAVGWLTLSGLALTPLVVVGVGALWPAQWMRRRARRAQAAAHGATTPRPSGTASRPATDRSGRSLPVPRPAHERFRLRSMSTDQLCRAWVDSRVPLKLSDHADQVERLARLRKAILDELETRHPHGVARWLADLGDGQPVDGSPMPYLSGRDGSSWRG
jgi:hypothetical protein